MIGATEIKKPFLFSIACLAAIVSIAQLSQKGIKPDQYRAIHWSMKDGLTDNLMNIMIKDAQGFLWVGSLTGELCRFDGASFKKYIPDLYKRGAINSGNISALIEDSLNNIWIGTAKGMSRYDMKADTFTNFYPVTDSVNSNRSTIPFWSRTNDVYCLEAGVNIVAYDVHSLKKRHLVTLTESDKTDRALTGVNYTVLDEKSNSLWIVEQDNTHSITEGLLQISLVDGKRKRYEWPCNRNSSHRHFAKSMVLDRQRNSIWINSTDGLLEFSLTERQFHHIEALSQYVKLKDYDNDVGIETDREGRIWLATRTNGILIYDPKTKQVQQLFSDPDLQKKIGDYNLHVYCDRDGIVWTSYYAGGLAGVYELLPFDPPVKRYKPNPNISDSLSNSVIYTIVPAGQGKMWIGTGDGLNIFDPVTEKFEVLREKDLPGIRGQAIVPLHIDTVSQTAWLNAGSADPMRVYDMDMYAMDIKTRKCKPMTFRQGEKQLDSFVMAPSEIKPYKNGFLVADDRHGVFEIQAGSLFAELVIPFDKDYLISNVILAEEQYLFLENYASLPHLGYVNNNGKWIEKPNPFDSLRFTSIFYDNKDKTYWISFKYELVHYDNKFRKIKTYREEDGYNGPIHNMLTDASGNLWFANIMEQVGWLNVGSGLITFLSEADGYSHKNFDWAVPMGKDAWGNVYLGTGLVKGTGGLDRVNPKKYSSAPTSFVYLRSLSINQKPFSSSIGVNILEKLSLPYNQNTISIDIGVIDYYSRGKGRIRYKLEGNGKDENWQYGPAYYTIRYEGLNPGSYRLVMQASNAGNEFNSPLKTVGITISPAFWNTWWFRIVAACCIVAFIYSLMRWRFHQKFRQTLERSEKEKQLAELQQQKTELEMQALRAQMNPHFIFNSLNSINRFILQNNKAQASEYLTKFSRLVRLILQNSQVALIPLESELESLQLYLELEAVRFDHHFEFKIIIEDDLDASALKVPPLIIQPYAENAIWHGLMHKEDKGHLEIELFLKEDALCCKITDDGVGRKKASELKSKSASPHKSMGMQITASRIEMLQQKKQLEAYVKITDLVLADGNAGGTEVLLKIPLMQ